MTCLGHELALHTIGFTLTTDVANDDCREPLRAPHNKGHQHDNRRRIAVLEFGFNAAPFTSARLDDRLDGTKCLRGQRFDRIACACICCVFAQHCARRLVGEARLAVGINQNH